MLLDDALTNEHDLAGDVFFYGALSFLEERQLEGSLRVLRDEGTEGYLTFTLDDGLSC